MMRTRTHVLPNDQCFCATWWLKAQIPRRSCETSMMISWIKPFEGSPVRAWALSGWAQPYSLRSLTKPMLVTSWKWRRSTNSLWRSPPPTVLWIWEREWQNSAEQQRACPTRRSEMPSIPHLGIETCPLWLKPTEFLSTEITETTNRNLLPDIPSDHTAKENTAGLRTVWCASLCCNSTSMLQVPEVWQQFQDL